MTEDRDAEIQQWFDRSIEDLPHDTFARVLQDRIRRTERRLRLRRWAALFVFFVSVCLLLPHLVVLLTALATTSLVALGFCVENWPILILVAMSLAWWLFKRARDSAFSFCG
ncbi:MAG: hypothetical protein IT494_00865 [Gammaproteobacteria bacterium]|nr:hypothetical protein [Gammaproteobacteria bacterium]